MTHRDNLYSPGLMNMDAEPQPEINCHMILVSSPLRIYAERVPEFSIYNFLELSFDRAMSFPRVRDLHPKPAPEFDFETGAVQPRLRIPSALHIGHPDQVGEVQFLSIGISEKPPNLSLFPLAMQSVRLLSHVVSPPA